jgi:hypothetical protein
VSPHNQSGQRSHGESETEDRPLCASLCSRTDKYLVADFVPVTIRINDRKTIRGVNPGLK